MKKASIVSIGNEILSGRTTDTNSAFLCAQLNSIGIPVVSAYTAPDEIDAIIRSIRMAAEDADLVLITGGLGPTDDDLTRQALADFLRVPLQLRQDLLDEIRRFFERRQIQMSERNRIQANMPAGSEPIINPLGTAPGISAEAAGKSFFALPGVPSEMKRMFKDSLRSRLARWASGQVLLTRRLQCFGAGESAIAETLGPLMRRDRNPLINSTVSAGVITLSIVAEAPDTETASKMLDQDETLLTAKLGNLVYATDARTLAEVVGRKLAQANKTLAVAESCTGGLLAKLLTDMPGASEYFVCGWVSYSNRAKIRELKVPPQIIEEHGAVSPDVAEAMAKGARANAATDFAIGITGIAGPAGATEHKPVGLVYISVVSAKGCDTIRSIFKHGRNQVRIRAAQTALNMLRLKLDA